MSKAKAERVVETWADSASITGSHQRDHVIEMLRQKIRERAERAAAAIRAERKAATDADAERA